MNAVVERRFWPSGSTRGIMTLKAVHEQMVDDIVSDPLVTGLELAGRYGYTHGWVYQVLNSPVFRERVKERRDELMDPIVLAALEQRFKGVISQSLDIMEKRLAKEGVTDNLVLRAFELATRAAGYGKAETNVQVNVEIDLETQRDRLVTLLHKTKAELDAP